MVGDRSAGRTALPGGSHEISCTLATIAGIHITPKANEPLCLTLFPARHQPQTPSLRCHLFNQAFPSARVTHRQRCYSVHTGKTLGTGGRSLSDIARARCAFERKGEELTSESRAAFSNCPWP